jgi:putative methyltransferase
MRVLISSLFYDTSQEAFTPYVYGLLRSACDQIPYLKENLTWSKPLYKLDFSDANIIDVYLSAIKEPPDLFGISCYSWNTNFQLGFSKILKKKFPNTLVVMGGPNVPEKDPQFFEKYPHVDFLIHGEGELVFCDLLEKIKKSEDLTEVANISIKGSGRTKSAPRDPKSMDIPSPYLSGYFDEIIKEMRASSIEPYALWETNRGCPYSCTFCDWGSATMTKVRKYSLEKAKLEAEWFSHNKIKAVYNCDANFGIFPQDEEIAKALSETKKRTGYPHESWFTFAKSSPRRVFSISKILHSSGLLRNGVTVSVQSMDKETLEVVKRKNLKMEDYKYIVKEMLKLDVPIYSEVLLGLPKETLMSFKKGIYELIEAGVHESLRFYNIDVLQNSELAEEEYRERYGIETMPVRQYGSFGIMKDPELCDGSNYISATKDFPNKDLIEAHVFALSVQLLHCTGWTRYLSIFFHREEIKCYEEFYNELFEYVKTKNNSVLSKVINKIRDEVNILYSSSGNELSHRAIWKQEDFIYNGKKHTVSGRVVFRAYIELITQHEVFFIQIKDFIESRIGKMSIKIQDVLKFQKDVMITPEYKKEKGKKKFYLFDHYSYFKHYQTDEPLKRGPIFLHFKDQAMGPGGNLGIKTDSLADFLKTVGNGTRLLPHFYTHQLPKSRFLRFL